MLIAAEIIYCRSLRLFKRENTPKYLYCRDLLLSCSLSRVYRRVLRQVSDNCFRVEECFIMVLLTSVNNWGDYSRDIRPVKRWLLCVYVCT